MWERTPSPRSGDQRREDAPPGWLRTLARLREDERLAGTPVVFLTARDMTAGHVAGFVAA